ncbi:UNVERIFIED_CONTAM: Cell cycle control protein 50A [Gekko kuhli]
MRRHSYARFTAGAKTQTCFRASELIRRFCQDTGVLSYKLPGPSSTFPGGEEGPCFLQKLLGLRKAESSEERLPECPFAQRHLASLPAVALQHSLIVKSNVFMYYGLSNFYQNHRRYVKSRDDSQLNGNNNSLFNPSKECEPYRTSEDNKPIAPCGAIANSMFNDTLTLYHIDQNGTGLIPLNKKGIAWWTDKYVKFRNPVGDDNNLTVLFHGTAKPVNWLKPVYMLDSDPDNNGFINEDFIVWMRTAALPTFRKLYRLIERKDSLLPALPAGKYSLDITYNYPVHSFDGRKRMILSTISWMGGKNPFLGIAYITVGSICFFLGVVLLIIHHKYGNRNNSADIPN